MKKIGLLDLTNVQGMAVLNGDKRFAKKLADILNEKIKFDISDEDYEYIMEDYTK